MTDRELLELAAMAADIKIWFSNEWHNRGKCLTGTIADNSPWNPLEDDGDAFRLAVKLRLTVKIEDHEIEVFDWAECLVSEAMFKGGDYESTARRAIVRAAALIGSKL